MPSQIFATLLLLISISVNLSAEEIQVPFVVENACPFEGCTFGEWKVLKDTKILELPDRNSVVVGSLKANTSVNIVSGIEIIIPGRAVVIDEPYAHKELINPEKEVLILNYWGEGRSQVFHDGNYFSIKIARSKDQCSNNPNWRYCWVKVLRNPISQWWVKVHNLGWVLMENKNLRPIDAFS